MDIAEQYNNLPQNVKDVIDKFSEMENDYESCENLVKELNGIGWTCEYYLDAEPYNLRRIIKKGDFYFFDELKNFSEDVGLCEAEFELKEYGKFVIGSNILVFEHKQKDITMTFVLIGMQGGEKAVYECVYTDHV
jgi:hypothetical protein